MPIPSGFASYIDLKDPLCYPGSGLIIDDLANPSVSWNISSSGAVYDGSVGALSLTTQNIEANGQLINTGDGPITIAGWIKVNSYSYGTSFNALPAVGNNTSGGNLRQVALYGATPNAVGIACASNTTGGAVYSASEQPINQWCFVVIKRNTGQTTSQITTYLNGAVDSLGAYGTNVNTSIAYTGTFSYGAINTTKFGENVFPMSISQIWMYNSYLSNGQVLDLYNATKGRYSLQTSFDFQNPACFTNGGTTITDLTGNGNNFTINNTSYTYDSTLGAITFPSGTYADGTPSDYAFGTNPFSVLAWVKFNPSNPGINVFHFGGDGTGERTYFYWRSSDNLIVSDNSGSAGAWDQTADSKWHLLAITRPSSSLCNGQKVYLDGNLIAFSSSAYNPLTPLNATTGVARIHSTVYGATGDLVIGTFDVYTSELSAGDITTIYNDTKDRFYPNLVAQYDFSNTSTWTGSGTTAYDLSLYGNNLTLTNSPTLAGTGQSKVIVFNGTNQDARKTTPLSGLTGTPFTINTWVKWPTLPNPATFAAVWTYGSAYPSAQWNGLFKMLVNPYITYVTGLGATQITSSTTNAPDTFYNLIITNNTPNTLNLYINGVSVGTATQSFTFEGSAGLYVASNLGGDGFSDSQIALLEVYKTGFGSTDVTNLYNTQLTRFNPTPPPPSSNGVGGRQFGQGFNG